MRDRVVYRHPIQSGRVTFDDLPTPVLTLGSDRTVINLNLSARTVFGSAMKVGVIWTDFLEEAGVPRPVVELLHSSACAVPLRLNDAVGGTWKCEAIVHQLPSSSHTIVMCWGSSREPPPTIAEAQHLEVVNDATLRVANTFNNQLTAITGVLQGIPGKTDDLHEALRIVRQAAVVVGDLQRTVRPPPPRLTLVDPAVVVLEALKAVGPDLRPGVMLETVLTDDRLSLHADHSQIRDAIVHLLTNANEAITGDGTIRVRLGSGTEMVDHIPPDVTPTDFIVIEIDDDGVGIPKVLLPRLYEPFFSTKNKPGLGLASVYQTVKQHHGGVTVDSSFGAGSTFRLFLPATPSGAAPNPESPSNETDATTPAHILVIDDDASVRRVVRKCLEREGMIVDEAPCGEDGLDKHREHDSGYHAIVLDIIMPGMSGWDVLSQLRSSGDDTPVVLQSGFVSEFDKAAVQKASAFLRKPYDLVDLTGAVKTALAEDRSGGLRETQTTES